MQDIVKDSERTVNNGFKHRMQSKRLWFKPIQSLTPGYRTRVAQSMGTCPIKCSLCLSRHRPRDSRCASTQTDETPARCAATQTDEIPTRDAQPSVQLQWILPEMPSPPCVTDRRDPSPQYSSHGSQTDEIPALSAWFRYRPPGGTTPVMQPIDTHMHQQFANSFRRRSNDVSDVD